VAELYFRIAAGIEHLVLRLGCCAAARITECGRAIDRERDVLVLREERVDDEVVRNGRGRGSSAGRRRFARLLFGRAAQRRNHRKREKNPVRLFHRELDLDSSGGRGQACCARGSDVMARYLVMGCGSIGGIMSALLSESGQDTTSITTNAEIHRATTDRGFQIRGDGAP